MRGEESHLPSHCGVIWTDDDQVRRNVKTLQAAGGDPAHLVPCMQGLRCSASGRHSLSDISEKSLAYGACFGWQLFPRGIL